ncbi:MAG: dihydropteroate synthase [Candidatus Omnitrophota bacterium]
MRKSYTINARHHCIQLNTTKVMGIINITPDSFSLDGCMRFSKNFQKQACRLALNHIRHGADILDIGGESTRPGASRVEAGEEIKRILPLIKRLIKLGSVPVSVDTNKAVVAKAALDAGANIINNIKGTRLNRSLLKMIVRYDAAIVLMHMGRGTPRTMQRKVSYQDLIGEIIQSLKESVEKCLDIGIKSDKIIIDPGIGFGKTADDNLMIIKRLKLFQELNKPILIGASRKSFIGRVLQREIHERLMGTAAAVALSIQNGASIVRVHDVKAMKDVAKMCDAINNEKANEYV